MEDQRFDHQRTYRDHVRRLKKRLRNDTTAMQEAIGGHFDEVGQMELDLLKWVGLPVDGFVIDVGCGSGRLAAPLSDYLKGRYLGTDIVPELLDHARRLVNRPDWRFEQRSDLTIPAADESADIVCFFSVFTHLLHEESYRYLQEARRVLKPEGRIVFSFLEFFVYSHWEVFRADIRAAGAPHPLNMFLSRDAIDAWAHHLGLEVENVFAGDVPFIPIAQPVTLRAQTFEKLATFGQSAAVLRRGSQPPRP
jgi:SAM-dependent methyltransferase